MPLKNQVLPPDTGKGVLKESGPAKTLFFLSWYFDSLEAQGVSTLQKPGSFSQFGVFFGRVPLKKRSYLRTQWVSMDLLETIGVMPGDLGDFLGTSRYETWTGFELVF